MTTAHAAIEAVVEAFRHAQRSGDAASATGLFTDDAVLYPPVAQAVVRGRAAIGALLETVHRSVRILDEVYTDLACDESGALGYAHWRYRIRVQARAGGTAPVTMEGRLLWVLRRVGGGWRIAVHHASLDPPPPPSAPTATPQGAA